MNFQNFVEHIKTRGEKQIAVIFCYDNILQYCTHKLLKIIFELSKSNFNSTFAYDSWVEMFIRKLFCNIRKIVVYNEEVTHTSISRGTHFHVGESDDGL
jgi:hypothetical protein